MPNQCGAVSKYLLLLQEQGTRILLRRKGALALLGQQSRGWAHSDYLNKYIVNDGPKIPGSQHKSKRKRPVATCSTLLRQVATGFDASRHTGRAFASRARACPCPAAGASGKAALDILKGRHGYSAAKPQSTAWMIVVTLRRKRTPSAGFSFPGYPFQAAYQGSVCNRAAFMAA